MKTFKFGIIALAAIGVCSFAFLRSTSELPVDKALYNKFVNEFEKVDLPYTLELAKPKNEKEYDEQYGWGRYEHERKNRLAYEYSKFIPSLARGYASRMGPDNFNAEILVAKNKEFTALVYSREPNYSSSVITYVLATFDDKGRMIDEYTIGGVNSGSIEEPTIGKDLKIAIKRYDVDDSGKNYRYDLTNTDYVQLMDNGKINIDGDRAMLTPNNDLQQTVEADLWSN